MRTTSPVPVDEQPHIASPASVASKPSARIERDAFGGLLIADGWHGDPIEHSGGALFVNAATVSAPLNAADYGLCMAHATLDVPAVLGPALRAPKGGALLTHSTVIGDIECDGPLGVTAKDSTVKGDIRTGEFEALSNVVVEGRVRVAGGAAILGANCHVDVLEIGPAAAPSPHPPRVYVEHGSSIGRIVSLVPSLLVELERSASVGGTLPPGVIVEHLERGPREPWDEEEYTPFMMFWSFGEAPSPR